MKGGTDMECPNLKVYQKFTAAALTAKTIDMSDIDQAISRKFVHWIGLGELDGPESVPYQRLGPEDVDTTEHRLLV